jgi:hypothetical protein
MSARRSANNAGHPMRSVRRARCADEEQGARLRLPDPVLPGTGSGRSGGYVAPIDYRHWKMNSMPRS